MRAAVELIDDFEDRLLQLLGRGLRREQPPYSKMRFGRAVPPGSRNRRPPGHDRGRNGKRLPTRTINPDARRFPKLVMHLLLRSPGRTIRKVRDPGDVAEAGELLQCVPGFGGQAGRASRP